MLISFIDCECWCNHYCGQIWWVFGNGSEKGFCWAQPMLFLVRISLAKIFMLISGKAQKVLYMYIICNNIPWSLIQLHMIYSCIDKTWVRSKDILIMWLSSLIFFDNKCEMIKNKLGVKFPVCLMYDPYIVLHMFSVLPRFEVTVDAPPTMYGRSTDPLTIKVTAR